jgi:hypothetical protein
VSTCDPATGVCSNAVKADGTACDDGNACTQSDTCSSGTCVAGAAPNCDDSNPCTNDSCDSEVGCVNAPNGVCTDDPKRRKFWKKVYRGKIPGETFTQADLECIQDSCLFEGIETLAEVYDKLSRGSQDDPCLRAESQMLTMTINVCRYRMLADRAGHVSCSGSTTVGAMKLDAEALMCTQNRTQDMCKQAKCIAGRINKKRL